MTGAWWAGVIAKSDKTPPLKSLLIDDEAPPKRKQDWREMKAAFQAALG